MQQLTKIKNVGYVKLDLEKLNAIQKALGSRFITQVGVLGAKAQGRKVTIAGKAASAETNADVGLIHEKGSISGKIPRRSFLLMPFQIKAEGLMAIRSALWHKFLAGDQSVASLKIAYRDLGILATRIIHRAFDTGGFGKWAKLAPSTIKRKGSSAILIDTRQLERSIDSRVVTR